MPFKNTLKNDRLCLPMQKSILQAKKGERLQLFDLFLVSQILVSETELDLVFILDGMHVLVHIHVLSLSFFSV